MLNPVTSLVTPVEETDLLEVVHQRTTKIVPEKSKLSYKEGIVPMALFLLEEKRREDIISF